VYMWHSDDTDDRQDDTAAADFSHDRLSYLTGLSSAIVSADLDTTSLSILVNVDISLLFILLMSSIMSVALV